MEAAGIEPAAGHYLRAKRKRLTASSYRDYESCLDKLARYFARPRARTTWSPRSARSGSKSSWTHIGASENGRTYNKNLSILRDFFKCAGPTRQAARRSDAADRAGKEARCSSRRPTRRISDARSSPRRRTLRDRLAVRLLLELRPAQGRSPDRPVQALRPLPAGGSTIFTKGERGAGGADPGILRSGTSSDGCSSRMQARARPLPATAAARRFRKREAAGSTFSDAPVPGQADGRSRPARLVVSTAWRAAVSCRQARPRGERMHKARHTAGQRCLTRPAT